MSTGTKNPAWVALHVAALPVEWIAHHIHTGAHRQMEFRFARSAPLFRRIFCKKTLHMVLGVFFMWLASAIYHNPPQIFYKEFWELSAFGIHGVGVAPIVKVCADLLGIEAL